MTEAQKTPARRQREIDFSDAARLREHLLRCGLAPVAAGLAALIVATGERTSAGVWTVSVSSRRAAKSEWLRCSDRAVPAGAATLQRLELLVVLDGGRGKPPLYRLDAAAAAALPTPAERLAELVDSEPVRSGAQWCEVVRTSPRVLQVLEIKNPCHPPSRVSYTGEVRSAHHCAPLRTTSQVPFPWASRGGVTDEELVAAVRTGDVALLRHLFDHAVRLGWIEFASDDAWLRFLTACHHSATARLQRRMGRLVVFVKQGLDVGRTTQASDQWAATAVRNAHRDPALVALGRSMKGDD